MQVPAAAAAAAAAAAGAVAAPCRSRDWTPNAPAVSRLPLCAECKAPRSGQDLAGVQSGGWGRGDEVPRL
eukprot:1161439-Pelagomonas_calceolata.AAC.11